MRFFDRALGTGRSIRVRITGRADGDFRSVSQEDNDVVQLRRSVVDLPWLCLQQVHGGVCVDVDAIGFAASLGVSADAAVTTRTDVALAIRTADCVPIALWSEDGAIAAVHAGWRGLECGVIESSIASLRAKTTAPLYAVIGPSIGPECYEFGVDDCDRLAARFGDSVRSRTAEGLVALDVRAGVLSELNRGEVAIVLDDATCTSCDNSFFSFRARHESGRQALVIWIEE